MKKQTKIIISIAIAVAAAAALYWFVLRKRPAIEDMTATSPADQAAYEQLYALFEHTIDNNALNTWLGDAARDYLAGVSPMTDTGRLVNGRMTKAGALLSAYAAGYWPYDYYHSQSKDAVTIEAYRIFSNFQKTQQ